MDDYISREALLAEIAADYGNWTVCNDTDESYRQGVKDNYNDTIRLINDIPAADVQPVKHGADWVQRGENYVCSHCGGTAPMDSNRKHTVTTKYCPHCGYKMG